jgi:hypothetical protein
MILEYREWSKTYDFSKAKKSWHDYAFESKGIKLSDFEETI